MIKLLIDAGNTLIKSATVQKGKTVPGKQFRTSLLSEKKLRDILKNTDICVCCSVVPKVTSLLKKICRSSGIKIYFLRYHDITLVKLKYSPLKDIGADRIASIIGALSQKRPPFIIVDIGSAVTCELVDKRNNYRGGVIFPGIELSLKALNEGCALLPFTAFSRPRKGPGSNTGECIRKGVWAATLGGIEKTVSDFLKREPGAAVFLTGSGSRFLRPGDLSFRYKKDQALVFNGLLQFYKNLYNQNLIERDIPISK